MSPAAWAGAGQGLALFALCHFLARVEIEIEGAHGWAEKLPTWRWGPEWWLDLTNGKTLTGYHLWLTLFLLAVFHFPLAVAGFSRALWAECLSSYLLLTGMWDLQWFVWNPAWGFARLRRDPVPWFRFKLLGLPVDYYFAVAASALATRLIWTPGMTQWAARAGVVLILSALSIPTAALVRARR
ncbi:MAG: hypothetical protein KGM24_09385 [Elusimicrobia bacterium]|nr:hypothetical protein [Elusimicrobiota bacterium]